MLHLSVTHAWKAQGAAGCGVGRSCLKVKSAFSETNFTNICRFFTHFLQSFPPTFAASFSPPSAPHLPPFAPITFSSTCLSHSLLHPSPGGWRPWKRWSTFPICCFFEVRPSFPRNLSFSSFTLHLPSPFSFCSSSSSAPLLLQLNLLLLFLGESPLSLSSLALLSHKAPLWSKFQMFLCGWGGTVMTPQKLHTHVNTHTHHWYPQLNPAVRLFLEKRL